MKKQMESSVMKGHTGRFSDVVDAAASASEPVKRKSEDCCVEPASDRKSFRVECVLGGYKLGWNKSGQWQEQEAVAQTVDEVVEALKAYLS